MESRVAREWTETGSVRSLSAWSWALYEWARNPYMGVCVVYVFAPYVALNVVGDAAKGQIYLANLNLVAGLVTCLTAPVLGAAADRAGGRKLPLLVISGAAALAMAMLWFVTPTPGGQWLWVPFMLAVAITFPLTEALHNAMIAQASGEDSISAVSGLGLALGGAATLILLIGVLVFIALPGHVTWSFIPGSPGFGLDVSRYEPQRVVPVVCAVWFLAFSLPLALFARDTPRIAGWGGALRDGFRGLGALTGKLRDNPNVLRFLAARMLYADGVTGLLVSIGVFAAAVMGWPLQQMAIFGLLMSLFTILGGLTGGALDRRLGPKRSIQLLLGVLLIGIVVLSSFQRDTVLWTLKVGSQPVWASPVFSSLPEIAFLGVMCLIVVGAVGLYATSRTMLVRLVPPESLGEFFGLYGLAGSATAWLGPLIVSLATAIARQVSPAWALQVGVGCLAVLIAAGLALVSTVRVSSPSA